MTPKEQAIEFLKQGLSQVQVAQALGLSESQISQWANETQAAEEISAAQMKVTKDSIKFDNTLDEIEFGAAEQLKKKLPFANLMQTMAILEKTNKLQRRALHKPGMEAESAQRVQLVLPTVILPAVVMNSKSEIIEVEGRTMISANQSQINRLLQQHTGKIIEEATVNQVKEVRAQELLETIPVREASKSQGARPKSRDLDLSDII